MSRKLSSVATILLSVLAGVSPAQKLTPLVHPAPDGAIVEYLMTDGSIVVQGGTCSDFWKLTPDNTGSYIKGSWKQIASLPSGRALYATGCAVLAARRLLIRGRG